jgi:hypothetical protein
LSGTTYSAGGVSTFRGLLSCRLSSSRQKLTKESFPFTLFLCRAADKMPKAVRKALQDVCLEHGGMDERASEEYLESLEKHGRFQEETWS